jgi:hypothetical protein
MQRLPTAHGVFRAEPLPDGWQLPYGSYPRAQSLQGPKDLRRRVEHSQLKIPTGSEDVRLPIAFQGRAGPIGAEAAQFGNGNFDQTPKESEFAC